MHKFLYISPHATLLSGVKKHCHFSVHTVFFLTFFSPCFSSGQIVISNQGAPAATIVNGFIGQGLTFSNASISCDVKGYGTFSNGNSTNIGLNTGAILCTGNTNQITGSPLSNVSTNIYKSCADPDLLALETSARNDCCILEFDIVPKCDQLSIRFVFASEEYPEYVNSSYNDAFGFFISGPDPQGGNYVNRNVAVLPNGTIASIDNINAGANASYYVTNTGATIAFDAFTTAITSTINLIPCRTYHFKLAIADASDHILDSGVFIDFIQCTNVRTVSVSSSTPACGLNNGSAQATVSNGFPPFTYTWYPAPPSGQGTATISGLSAQSTYTLIVDDAYSCITPDTSIIHLNGTIAPALTVNSSSVCEGHTATLAATVSNTGGNFTWAPGGSSASSISVSPATSTTYTCTYTYNDCVVTDTATITVNPKPVLACANKTICAGSSVILHAAGASSYTWWPLTGLSASSGDSVTANPLSTSVYTLYGSSLYGCTDSTTVTVQVNPSPAVAVNNGTICAGESFPLIASGATTYYWEPGTGLSGNSGAALVAQPGSSISYTVTGTTNGCSSKAIASITVNPIPVITVNNSSVCSGNTAALTASGANNYTWQPVTGLNNSSGTNVIAQPAVSTTYTVTGTSNGCSASALATVTIKPVPQLNALSNQTLCHGMSTGVINFSSNYSGTTVQWTNNAHSIGLASSGSGNISSFTAINTSANPIMASLSATPSLNGCTGAAINTNITVNPLPHIQVNQATLCAGDTALLFASGADSYSWTPGTGLSSSSAATVSASPASTTTYTLSGTRWGCTSTSTTTVTVKPVPVVQALNNEVLCANTNSTAVHFNSNPSGAIFTWVNSLPSIGLPASGSGNIGSFQVKNNGQTPVYATISVSPSLAGCTGPAANYTIQINPLPLAQTPPSQSVCNGEVLSIAAFSSSPQGASFNWINTNTAIGLASGGSGNIPSFTGQNTTTADISAQITLSPTLNGCTGNTVSFQLAVKPTPGSPIAHDTVYCLNATAMPLQAIASGGGTLLWYGTAAIGGNASVIAPIPSTALATTYSYYVSQVVNGCESPRKKVLVTINKLPIANNMNNQVYCANTQVPFITPTGTAGASFYWTNSNTAIGLAASGSSAIPTFTAINNTAQTIASIISVTPQLNGCLGIPIHYTLEVSPAPVMNVSDYTLCNRDTFSGSNFISSPPGASYSWNNTNSGIGLAAIGSGNIPVFYAVNNTTQVHSANVNVIPVLNGCSGSAKTFSILVNPTPPKPQTADKVYCKNTPANALTASGTGGTFSWYTQATAGIASSTAPIPSTANVGNYNYYVSQTINNCESPRDTVLVKVLSLPEAELSAKVSGCPPLCNTFSLNTSNTLNSVNWEMGDNSSFQTTQLNTSYCYNNSGVYSIKVIITDSNHCKSTLSFEKWVEVFAAPVSNFSYTALDGTELSPGIQFENSSTGEELWSFWSFGDPQQSSSSENNPLFTYPGAGDYEARLITINKNGCRDTMKKSIHIAESWSIYIPNAFSPNGDGVNDVFIPQAIGINKDAYSLWVFDRWGNMIFFSKHLEHGWDGMVLGKGSEPAQQDTYVWKIKCKDFMGIKHDYTGTVSIVK